MLNIETTIPQAVDGLRKFARKQVPFATALALTWTAVDARDQLREDMAKRFVVRSPWIQRGVISTKATKRKLESSVFSRDAFMLLQEEGGKKRGGRHRIALPRSVRKSPKQRITRARRPARLLAKPNTFLRPMPGNPGTEGIMQRVGKSGRLRLLYVLSPETMRIEPRFGMRKTVDRVVARRWQKNFGKALRKALATAK